MRSYYEYDVKSHTNKHKLAILVKFENMASMKDKAFPLEETKIS